MERFGYPGAEILNARVRAGMMMDYPILCDWREDQYSPECKNDAV